MVDRLWRTGWIGHGEQESFGASFIMSEAYSPLTCWKERLLGIGWHTPFFSWSHKRLKVLTLQVSSKCWGFEMTFIYETRKREYIAKDNNNNNALSKIKSYYIHQALFWGSRSSSRSRPDFTINVWLCVCVFVYIVQVSKQLKKRMAAFTMLNIFLLRAVFYVQYISIVSLIRSFYFLVKHDFRFSSSLTNTNYFPHELKNHESNNRSRTYFHRFMLILLLLL